MDPSKIHDIIAELISQRGKEESRDEFLEQLHVKTMQALQKLSPCEDLQAKMNETDKITVQFVTLCLYVLKQIASNDDELKHLISIQQQSKINLLLQMIFSLGIANGLSQGVNIYLAHKSAEMGLINLEDLSPEESYNMMASVVRSLLELIKAPNLRALLLGHLGDLMSSLIQLIHIGNLKKPGMSENKEDKNIWTDDFCKKIKENGIEFKNAYNELINHVYKPLVIKELIVLMAVPPDGRFGNASPPTWLRNNIARQITGHLVGPGGVSFLMRAIFNKPVENLNWKEVRAIAGMLSKDLGILPRDEYYSRICPQIVSLLDTTGPYCVPVAKECMRIIYRERTEMFEKYMLNHLLEPFVVCSQPMEGNFEGVLVSEDALSGCIDHLEKCFSPGSKESTLPFKTVIKIIKIMYKLFMKIAPSAYQHKTVIQDLLIRFLHSFDNRDKLSSIYNALIFNESCEGVLDMGDDLEFEFGPSGGVQVVKGSKTDRPSPPQSLIRLKYEEAGDLMLDLLSANKDYSKKLLFDLFIVLLSSMSNWYDDIPTYNDVPYANRDLLSADELIMYVVERSEKKIVSIKLLSVLAENIQVMDCVQEKPELIFEFIKSLLDKKAENISNEGGGSHSNEDDEFDEKQGSSEDLIVTLGILDVMTANIKTGGDRWDSCRSLVDPLKIIKDNYHDFIVKSLANQLYEKIVTRGSVSGSRHFTRERQENDVRLNESNTETGLQGNDKPKSSGTNVNKDVIFDSNKLEDDKTVFEAALEESCSGDVPTRGHGLIQLVRLIKTKDAETDAKRSSVLAVLKENLRHEDTYVYLAAINGLEALANAHTDVVLELLTNEYVDSKIDNDQKMKVGEALVRVTRMLGAMVPKYKTMLVATFLAGAKHEDEFVRASSLSNLGEVLKILSFGVGSYLQEVYVCVERIAATDKSDVARRAAVMVAKLLLSGVTESTFMLLESVIRDLYRTLLHIYKTDRDEVTKLHADLALAEIDRLVRSSFSRNLKLEKHIGILNLPL